MGNDRNQLYATRRSLSALAAAVDAQPDEVRARIAALARANASIR